MKMNNQKLWLTLGSVLALLISCSEDDPLDDNSPNPPKSYAGPDIVINLPVDSVLLSGKASDIDGYIVKHEWVKTDGPGSFAIVSPLELETKVKGLTEGFYTFTLKVTDNQGLTGIDDMMVRVKDTSNHDNGEGDWDY